MATRRGFGRIDKLSSGKFRARYAGPDGRLHKASHTFAMKGHAESWLSREELLISVGEWTPPEARAQEKPAHILTMDAYSQTVLDRRTSRSRKPLRPLTRQDYDKLLRLHVLPVIGELPLTAITPAVIRDWYDHCAPGHPTTRGKAYDLVHSILADAESDGLIDRNPCQIVGGGKPKRHKQVDALPADALVDYIAAIPDHYRLPLMIAATCALRSGELRGLRRRDVDLRSGVIHVRQQLIEPTVDGHVVYEMTDPKTDAGSRDVAMPAMLLPLLKEWGKSPPAAGRDALLFPARDGHSPMPSASLYKNHKAAAAKIGRPNLTVHDLRRTAATLAGEGGATTAELMRLLGHTTPAVALMYQVPDARRDRDRADRLDAVIREAQEG